MSPYKTGITAHLIKIRHAETLEILPIFTDNATGPLILQRTYFHETIASYLNFLSVTRLTIVCSIIISDAFPTGCARH